MIFNATFNNISAISWRSVLLVVETGCSRRKPPTCRKSLKIFITKCCIEYTSLWAGFELTTSVMISIDCTGSCKSNYHTITTTTAPSVLCSVDYCLCFFFWPLYCLSFDLLLLITPLVSSDYLYCIFWLPLWYLLITPLISSDYPFGIFWLPL